MNDRHMTRLDTIYNAVFASVARELKTASNLGAIIEKRAKRQVNPRAAIDAEISRAARELETINRRLAGLYEVPLRTTICRSVAQCAPIRPDTNKR